uniref:Spermatosis associated 22 n=1 Tax=Sphenodon punctatus TaxID=8508 RepID=A0A8D0GLB0_SPHPU
MKRNLTESSVRSTAGCLPVPLFNQKKRNRIPLTSNPLKNEPSSSVTTHSFDFSPTSTVPGYQLKLKEKDNSLRIISAVIESMKHWSQYTYKTALLFEVLGTLDSAVTPGSYGAKSFVLRDGKESVSCIFYEIDRELPRLIRGRVHRCMGNYDTKKNIFKCVSVRPAIVTEQKTFQEFVKIADMEMREYVKTMNEV